MINRKRRIEQVCYTRQGKFRTHIFVNYKDKKTDVKPQSTGYQKLRASQTKGPEWWEVRPTSLFCLKSSSYRRVDCLICENQRIITDGNLKETCLSQDIQEKGISTKHWLPATFFCFSCHVHSTESSDMLQFNLRKSRSKFFFLWFSWHKTSSISQ